MTPQEFGRTLCGNAINKHGKEFANPEQLLVSDSFDKLCEGRKLTKFQRELVEQSYQQRWAELTR